jgi:hypothetical protein
VSTGGLQVRIGVLVMVACVGGGVREGGREVICLSLFTDVTDSILFNSSNELLHQLFKEYCVVFTQVHRVEANYL